MSNEARGKGKGTLNASSGADREETCVACCWLGRAGRRKSVGMRLGHGGPVHDKQPDLVTVHQTGSLLGSSDCLSSLCLCPCMVYKKLCNPSKSKPAAGGGKPKLKRKMDWFKIDEWAFGDICRPVVTVSAISANTFSSQEAKITQVDDTIFSNSCEIQHPDHKVKTKQNKKTPNNLWLGCWNSQSNRRQKHFTLFRS